MPTDNLYSQGDGVSKVSMKCLPQRGSFGAMNAAMNKTEPEPCLCGGYTLSVLVKNPGI